MPEWLKIIYIHKLRDPNVNLYACECGSEKWIIGLRHFCECFSVIKNGEIVMADVIPLEDFLRIKCRSL